MKYTLGSFAPSYIFHNQHKTLNNLYILTCGPVQTSFQVDIEIYEDKLSESGDRILSSHITKNVIIKVFLQFFYSNKDK